MTTLDAYSKLIAGNMQAIRTSDASKTLQMMMPATCKALHRMETAGLVTKLKRDIWVVGKQDPLKIAKFIIDPYPGYVSLASALRYHGMISQIPGEIYMVSTTKPHSIETKFGTFSIHQLPPRLVTGYSDNGIATPEKALIDYLYLSSTRSGTFANFPELELPDTFDVKKAEEWCNLIQSAGRHTLVRSKLRKIVDRT